jgi:HlyD family secretion protein
MNARLCGGRNRTRLTDPRSTRPRRQTLRGLTVSGGLRVSPRGPPDTVRPSSHFTRPASRCETPEVNPRLTAPPSPAQSPHGARPTPALALTLATAAFFGACRPQSAPPATYQGYLEADFIYVAAPLAGRVEQLPVREGDRVTAGQTLFVLEHTAELAALREAEQRHAAARARLADLSTGLRPTELAALEAQLAQARAAAELAAIELRRVRQLQATGVLPDDTLDRARLGHERATQAETEAAARLDTAQLGAREAARAAAEAEAEAAAAARERAAWAVREKHVVAPAGGRVHDRLYREREYAPAGRPVVVLLPPAALRVRFYVPAAALDHFPVGGRVAVHGLGPTSRPATVDRVSSRPEFTPPVLFNRDNRHRLVHLVEARRASSDDGPALHPGRPVDVAAAAPR